MEENEVNIEVEKEVEVEEKKETVKEITPNEIEQLEEQIESLRTRLATAERERDEAHRAFLNSGQEIQKKRDLNTLLEDIE